MKTKRKYLWLAIFLSALFLLFKLSKVLALTNVTINVYPNQEVRDLPALGVNVWPGEFLRYNNNPAMINAVGDKLSEANFKYLRYPGGCVVDAFDPINGKATGDSNYEKMMNGADLKMFWNIVESTDTEVLWQIPMMGQLPVSSNNPQESLRSHTYINPCGMTVTQKWTEAQIISFVQENSVNRKARGQKYIKIYQLGNEEWGERTLLLIDF